MVAVVVAVAVAIVVVLLAVPPPLPLPRPLCYVARMPRLAALPVAFAAVAPLVLCGAAHADDPPALAAQPADAVAVVLDGRLDEPVWAAAAFAESFTQKAPDEGARPTQRTRFSVLRTERSLVFGVACLDDDPDGIVARLARRDRVVEADAVELDIDSRGDGSSAFHFEVGAGGTLLDGIRSAGGEWNSAWDGLWDAEVSRDDRGWYAEIEIPLSTLRFTRTPGLAFALQVRRTISRRHELDEWAYFPREAGGEIVHYGRLTGLDDLPTPWPLDLAPFLVDTVTYRSSPDPDTTFWGWEPRWDVGLDATLRLGTSLALDVAVNPDFGQVEQDEVVLNLSTFEIQYAEKRPFFLAGRELFQTTLPIFYSRRIGAVPEVPELPDDWTLERNPAASRIWSALKLTGELAPGWTIGVIDALTARQDLPSLGPRDAVAGRLADPLTNFGVLRLRHDFGGDNSLGLLATTVNRFEPDDAYLDGLCPVTDVDGSPRSPAGGRCFHDAYLGAVDGRFRTPDGDWSGEAQAVVTGVVGGPSLLLADGTRLDDGDVGWAGALDVLKDSGHWRGEVYNEIFSAEYWPTDAGYLERGNMWRLYAEAEYWTDELDACLEFEAAVVVSERVTLSGLSAGQRYGLEAEMTFRDESYLWLNLAVAPARWDDRELLDGAVLERSTWYGLEYYVETDSRQPVTFWSWGLARVLDNGWAVDAEAGVGFKPFAALTIDLLPTVNWIDGEPRRLRSAREDAAGRHYLLGTLESGAVGATLRTSFAFTPHLTLQAFGQLFLAAGHYGPFWSYDDPARGRPRIALDALVPAPAPAGNPDFSEVTFNTSVVLRWEYLPGSLLWLVYTHAERPAEVSGDGRLDIGLFGNGGSADTVLLKLGYLWN